MLLTITFTIMSIYLAIATVLAIKYRRKVKNLLSRVSEVEKERDALRVLNNALIREANKEEADKILDAEIIL